ncbi:histone acetyltransferase HAC1-like [Bidens hawaiensis]|uniref:histone acetyltransferase HAC1-like n=1 Tax=Bidens hawaiensis TaxID=980011 RepID=UPI00404A3944
MRRQQTQELYPKKMIEIVRRLEEGLFKTATTKEEYMNIDTLENRLHDLIKHLPFSNYNQQYPQGSTSVPAVTMIPNPGMHQSGKSSLMVPSTMDTMVPPAVYTGNVLPDSTPAPNGVHNGSLSSSDDMSGQVPNQSGTSLSVMPRQQNIMQSSGGQCNTDPGFVSARRYIQEKIHDFLMLRQPTHGVDQKKMIGIVRCLEEGLFKTATTKEEYMNIDTLESRVQALIKSCPIAPPAVNTGNSN